MGTIANERMGAALVTFKGVDIGHTLGGVKFKIDRKFSDLKADQYGESPVDAVLTGTDATLAFKAAEPVVSKLANLFPEGSYQTGSQGSRITFGTDAGVSMRALAGLLTLHPVSKPTGDASEDVVFYLAYPSAAIEINYEVNNQRVYEVTMRALVDEEYTSTRRLGHIGATNIS